MALSRETPIYHPLFQDNLGKPAPEMRKVKQFWILMKQQTTWWWQWHQLDHMQIICTLLQTGNHASTLSLNFYRTDALPDTQPTFSNFLPISTEITLIVNNCRKQYNTEQFSK